VFFVPEEADYFSKIKTKQRTNTQLQALFECFGDIKGSGISPAILFIPVCLTHASDKTSTNCIPRMRVRSTIAQEYKGHTYITATLKLPTVNHDGHVCFEKTQNVMGSL